MKAADGRKLLPSAILRMCLLEPVILKIAIVSWGQLLSLLHLSILSFPTQVSHLSFRRCP